MKVLTITFNDDEFVEWREEEYTSWIWNVSTDTFDVYNETLVGIYKLADIKHVEERTRTI